MRIYTLIVGLCLNCVCGYANRVWIVANTNPVTSSAGEGRANRGDLKYCLDKYQSGDVITFDSELAGKVIYFEVGVSLKTNASLTIDASHLSENVIFDGSFRTSSPKRINVLINGSQGYGTNYFTIRGVTFQNICAQDIATNTGALLINHGVVMIEECAFRNNLFYTLPTTSGSSVQGAIICLAAGRSSLTVRGCQFINNLGRRGASISLWPFKQALIDACYFDSNNTYAGGACLFVNSSGTNTGAASLVEIRNSTMTRNKGNAVGTLVQNIGSKANTSTRIVGCTMVNNVSTSTSTQMSMVNVVGRRLELGGSLFGGNLNQRGVAVSDLALGASSSAVLAEDSLTLLGYNLFSKPTSFGIPLSDAKLMSTPHNLVYRAWDTHPLTESSPTEQGVLVPTHDDGLVNEYLSVIPRAVMNTWMYSPAYDQQLLRRVAPLSTVGAYELNAEGSGTDVEPPAAEVTPKIIMNNHHGSFQLVGFGDHVERVALYGVEGRLLKSFYKSLSTPFPMYEFSAGVYVVAVSNQSFKIVKKDN